MARTFKFDLGTRISWPPVCVVCGAPHPRTDKTHGSIFSGLGWWGLGPSVKYKTVTLEFPICKRHYIFFRLARFFYFFSFLALVSSVTQMFLWQELDGSGRIIVALIFVIALMVFVTSVFVSPVRVKTGSDGSIHVKIANGIYARAFNEFNREIKSGNQTEG